MVHGAIANLVGDLDFDAVFGGGIWVVSGKALQTLPVDVNILAVRIVGGLDALLFGVQVVGVDTVTQQTLICVAAFEATQGAD